MKTKKETPSTHSVPGNTPPHRRPIETTNAQSNVNKDGATDDTTTSAGVAGIVPTTVKPEALEQNIHIHFHISLN